MRHFARRSRLKAPVAVTGLAILASTAIAATTAAPALAAGPITVKAAWGSFDGTDFFTGIDSPDTLTYTISNPSTTDTIGDISFTDTLPSSVGASIAATGGVLVTYAGCGSSVNDTNTVGSGTVTVSNVTVAPAASASTAATCKIVVDVTPTKAGAATDSISSVAYTDTTTASSGTVAATNAPNLIVLDNPRSAFTVPKRGATYAYGQKVTANYSCTEPDQATYAFAAPTCVGFDDLGNEVDNGGFLDTLDTGHRKVTVDATNAGFGLSVAAVSFRVKPFVLSGVKASGTKVGFGVKLPIAGKLTGKVFDGQKQIGKLSNKVTKAGKVKRTVKLSAAGKRLVAKAGKKGLKLKLVVDFTPSPAAVASSPTFGTLGSDPGTATVTKAGIKLK